MRASITRSPRARERVHHLLVRCLSWDRRGDSFVGNRREPVNEGAEKRNNLRDVFSDRPYTGPERHASSPRHILSNEIIVVDALAAAPHVPAFWSEPDR